VTTGHLIPALVKALKGHKKVRWKDSIKAVLKKSGAGDPGL
jgi:hypothetical protein